MLFLVPGKVHEVHQQVCFLNERLLVHQIFQECLHLDRLSRNQFLSVRKAGFWLDIQKYGGQPAENFEITFDNCLPRYGWQFLTRWLTSCSSLGNSLSPLSSPLFPSSTSLEASMNRSVTQWARTNNIDWYKWENMIAFQLALSIFSNKRKMMSTAMHTRSSLRSAF